MSSFNKVILMGNLTRDVEIRNINASATVGNFGLAVNRKYKTQSGEQREEVTFVDCEAWGKQAEIMAQYVSKGSPLMVEGRLKLEQWESEGGKRSKLLVVVETFQFVGGSNESQRSQRQDSGGSNRSIIDHDDIPF